MSFKEGDFVEVEYSAWRAVDNALLSTTDAKKAKEGDIYDEKAHYGPVLVVLGSNGVVKGLDREIRLLKIGETKKFTLKPEEAFGNRDEQLVRVIPLSEFREQKIEPYPGMRLNMDNMSVTVKSVSSGRVTVDANPPEAGQDITYELKVVKLVEAEKDRIASLASTFHISPTDISINGGVVSVTFGEKVVKNYDYFLAKANLIAASFTYIKGANKFEIKEEYLKPEEPKEEKK